MIQSFRSEFRGIYPDAVISRAVGPEQAFIGHCIDKGFLQVATEGGGRVMLSDRKSRIEKAIDVAVRYGGIDGDHHKAWVIDQMVRELTGCPMQKMINEYGVAGPFEYEGLGESDEYTELVVRACEGADGPETYSWDVGIAP